MPTLIHNNSNTKELRWAKAQSGFTLLELLLVIALIGILASISIGRYNRYVEESNRRAAITQLYATQQSMERTRLQSGHYASLPALQEHGYRFTFEVSTDGSAYTLKATPIQGGDAACGVLSIDQKDERQVSVGAVADCWQ